MTHNDQMNRQIVTIVFLLIGFIMSGCLEEQTELNPENGVELNDAAEQEPQEFEVMIEYNVTFGYGYTIYPHPGPGLMDSQLITIYYLENVTHVSTDLKAVWDSQTPFSDKLRIQVPREYPRFGSEEEEYAGRSPLLFGYSEIYNHTTDVFLSLERPVGLATDLDIKVYGRITYMTNSSITQ